MSSCSHDCKTCSQNCGERTAPQSLIEKPHEMSSIKKVIGIVSGKGGVGKSLVTSLLATTMQKKGYRTAILDGDITGPSIPKSFGITEKAMGDGKVIYPAVSKGGVQVMSLNLLLPNETDPVVWRGSIIANTVKQFWTDVYWKDVDFMFVDMPPGTGDVPLTVFQSLPVDGIIVVTSPQELVSMIVEKAVKMADMMKIPLLGLVENMSYFKCPNCDELHYIYGNSHLEELAEKHHIPATARLPIDPMIASACDRGAIEVLPNGYLDALAAYIETHC